MRLIVLLLIALSWTVKKYFNAFEPSFKLDESIFLSFENDDDDLRMTNQEKEKDIENIADFEKFVNAA